MISQTTNADKMLQSVLSDSTIIKKIGLHPDDYCRIDDALVSDNPIIRSVAMMIAGVSDNETERNIYTKVFNYLKDNI